MATVTVRDYRGGRSIVLDSVQTDLFMKEFGRTRHFAEPDRRPPVPIAPDCIVEVDDRGKTATYELLGRAVLRDPKKHRQFQFYFGLMLLEWLAQ